MVGSFEDLVKVARNRTHDLNKDCVIAVCGYPGLGKSCLALQLGYATDPEFSPSESVLFYPSLERAKKMFGDLGEKRAIVFDESMMTMYLRKSQTKENISLNQFFSVNARKEFNDVVILVIESMSFLDKYFRSGRIQYWVQIIDRTDKDAYAVVFTKDSSPFASDPWRIKMFDKMWQDGLKYTKVVNEKRQDWARAARKSRLFFGDFIFKDLPKRVWDEYHDARLKAKEEFEKDNPSPVKRGPGRPRKGEVVEDG